MREAYFVAGRANQFYSHYHKCPAEIEDLVAIIKNSTGHSFYVGHYLYGALKADPNVFVTLVRNPIPRILSCYQWMKNKREAKGEAFMSLEEFVRKGKGVAHTQINQFAVGFGSEAPTLRKSLSAEAMFNRAVEALQNDFLWFGISELFEETIYTLAAICGLHKVPVWRRDTRNTGRRLVSEIGESDKQLLATAYHFDVLFYDCALRLFRERLDHITLSGDIESYRAACVSQYKDRLLPGSTSASRQDVRKRFDDIYSRNLWRGEVRSGPGSTSKATSLIRPALDSFIKDAGVRVLFDAPCGDGAWITPITQSLAVYIGYDVVEEVIESNRMRYAGSHRFFFIADLIDTVLPRADAILCRDCLVHLPFKEGLQVLRNFKASGSKYLIATTFVDRTENAEAPMGNWRPLNLTRHPFNLPEPTLLVRERALRAEDMYNDKALGVWRLGEVDL